MILSASNSPDRDIEPTYQIEAEIKNKQQQR
jgi:hypothetical protein